MDRTGLTGKYEPAETGRKLAVLFAGQKPDFTRHYREACSWSAALAIAGCLKDRNLMHSLLARYKPFKKSYDDLLSGQGHVDNNVFGIVPFEIGIQTGDKASLQEGLEIAEHQYKNLENQIRYAIDDMFMITALQVQAFRVSRNYKYLDAAADAMEKYLNKLQQKDGLFYHHHDFRHKWGRGNGWVAVGMARMLSVMRPDHSGYGVILNGYKKMMEGLLGYQINSGRDSGLWKQIIDSDDERNWAESSGSAMFCSAMVMGLTGGLLEESRYQKPAVFAWKALVDRLDENGRLSGTSKWAYYPDSEPDYDGRYDDDEENYYFEREQLCGDDHGQAPCMWSALALMTGKEGESN